MDMTLLGEISWWRQGLAVLLVVVCLLLVVIVLLQKGRGGGLAAAFGGAGGQSAFGSKTGDVFTWVTIVAAVVFLLLSMLVSVVYMPQSKFDEAAPVQMRPPAEQPVGEPVPASDAAESSSPEATEGVESAIPSETAAPTSEAAPVETPPSVPADSATTDTPTEEEN